MLYNVSLINRNSYNWSFYFIISNVCLTCGDDWVLYPVIVKLTGKEGGKYNPAKDNSNP